MQNGSFWANFGASSYRGRAEPILKDLVQEAYTDPPRDVKKRRFSFFSVIFSRPRSASAGERDLEAVNSVIDTNSDYFSYGFCGFMVVDVVSILAPPRCKRGGASFGSSQQHYDANSMRFGMVFGVRWWSMLFLVSRPRSASAGERALDALSSVMET